jgi:hypothetical protein
MKYVKLTDEHGETFNHTKWGPGVVLHTSGEGGLCSAGWLHCYGSDTESRAALLAVLLNPLHCNFQTPRGWRVECRGELKSDNGLKVGTTAMECLEEIILPNVTTTQRVAFAILCASKVYKDAGFQTWASEWLSGRDRSAAAAWSARATAMATATEMAFRRSGQRWSAWSARATAMATATAMASRRSGQRWSAWSAASWAMRAAAEEAATSWSTSARAAWEAVVEAAGDLDLGLIAEEAMSY